MSHAYQINRHIDREEDRLWKLYDSHEISREEYNAEMRGLQREAREAYEEDQQDAAERVRDEWSW